ncbi:hypothetical protein AHAS_Ahas05G0066800 [Arachis hypogaea]
MDFVLEVSAINVDSMEANKQAIDMLHGLSMSIIPGVVHVEPMAVLQVLFGRGGFVGGSDRRF